MFGQWMGKKISVEDFLEAAKNGTVRTLEYYLKQHKKDASAINETVSKSNTALMLAAQRGHVAAVQLLLKHHAAVNVINHDHNTALHLAVHQGHAKVVSMLLNVKGIKIDTKNKTNKTPIEMTTDNEILTMLYHAKYAGDDKNRDMESLVNDDRSPKNFWYNLTQRFDDKERQDLANVMLAHALLLKTKGGTNEPLVSHSKPVYRLALWLLRDHLNEPEHAELVTICINGLRDAKHPTNIQGATGGADQLVSYGVVSDKLNMFLSENYKTRNLEEDFKYRIKHDLLELANQLLLLDDVSDIDTNKIEISQSLSRLDNELQDLNDAKKNIPLLRDKLRVLSTKCNHDALKAKFEEFLSAKNALSDYDDQRRMESTIGFLHALSKKSYDPQIAQMMMVLLARVNQFPPGKSVLLENVILDPDNLRIHEQSGSATERLNLEQVNRVINEIADQIQALSIPASTSAPVMTIETRIEMDKQAIEAMINTLSEEEMAAAPAPDSEQQEQQEEQEEKKGKSPMRRSFS